MKKIESYINNQIKFLNKIIYIKHQIIVVNNFIKIHLIITHLKHCQTLFKNKKIMIILIYQYKKHIHKEKNLNNNRII